MKTIQQLSIFLENKIGSLYEVMDILSGANIRIIAATVADTSEYGILRLITTNNTKALEVLRLANKSANTNEVIAIGSHSSAGAFYDKLKYLSSQDVVVEYMYCFSIKENAFLILKPNNIDKAGAAIDSFGIETLSNNDLNDL